MNNKRSCLIRRKKRVRSKLAEKDYRLSLFRSSKFLYAQLIDGKNGKTIIGGGEKKFIGDSDKKKTKTERAKLFGLEFAKKVLGEKVKRVVFDRGGYLYHGRVKAFAEGAREGGLQF